MIPTLLVGDLILVNKYHYGVRLPVINKKIIANNDPQRGDVMVFRYPPTRASTTSSASSACPATRWPTCNQRLYLNGQPVPTKPLRPSSTTRTAALCPSSSEKLGAVEHRILLTPSGAAFRDGERKLPHSGRTAATVPKA